MKCLQCESTRIVTNARAVDRGEGNYKSDLKLEVYGNPDAWIFKDTHASPLKANVCADCGFVMFFVSVDEARQLERQKQNGENRRRS